MKYGRIRSMARPLMRDRDHEIRVFVNSDDKDHLPHFHIQLGSINPRTGKWIVDKESRIRLDVAEYLSPKDYRISEGTLSWLDSGLREIYINGMTFWEFACFEWNNGSYSNTQFTPPKSQPNYRKV